MSERLYLSLPRTGSLLFAGPALYLSFIDPRVLGAHTNIKDKLIHWSTMYNSSLVPMASIAILTTIFGLKAYLLTKENLWLWGSGAMFAALPWTFLFIMPTNNELAQDLENIKIGSTVSKSSVLERLARWLWRHKVRAGLALISAGLFYAAEGKSKFLQERIVDAAKSLDHIPRIQVALAPA